MTTTDAPESLDFIRTIVTEDVRTSRHAGRVATRFPPEPNGYLHIGHAKSICLNFGVAREFGGSCNLRFDDTNPAKEDVEYVDSIKADVTWLGFDWTGLFYASDYFEALYGYAHHLIRSGLAYVDGLTPDEIREYRGTLTEPGKNSPYRDRPVAENVDLFTRMRAGEFEDGSLVLRAKIDMASPNINMRDPVLYRVRRITHHRTGDAWSIYPTYDYAHPISDAIEKITHSLCTLEFEDHRPLYDWLLANLPVPSRPQQIEFARLNLTYTVMSKRKLLQLVVEKHVSGWDDPRMPTIVGLRRRGFTPEALRDFCERVGVAKKESIIDVALLEHCVREDLNRRAPRVLAVLRPLKVIIENLAEGEVEQLEAVNNPEDPAAGTRHDPVHARDLHRAGRLPRGSAEEVLPPQPGQGSAPALRLHHQVRRRRQGGRRHDHRAALHLRSRTRSGDGADTKRVQATIHWVSAAHGRRRRGAALRSPVHERAARRGRHRLPDRAQPGRARSAAGLRRRAEPRRRLAGDALPVRAPRLLRRRPRLDARSPGLQPHGHAARPVGEDQQGPEGVATRAAQVATAGRPGRSVCYSRRWRAAAPNASGQRALKAHPHRRTPRVPDHENPHVVRRRVAILARRGGCFRLESAAASGPIGSRLGRRGGDGAGLPPALVWPFGVRANGGAIVWRSR